MRAFKWVRLYYDPELAEAPVLVSPVVYSPVTLKMEGDKEKLLYAIGRPTRSRTKGIFLSHPVRPSQDATRDTYTHIVLEGEAEESIIPLIPGYPPGPFRSFIPSRVVGFAELGEDPWDAPDGDYRLLRERPDEPWLAILNPKGKRPWHMLYLELSLVLDKGEVFFTRAEQ